MKEIKIEDFITIKILELNEERSVYFVDSYNEDYFYKTENDVLNNNQNIYIVFTLKFYKGILIYTRDLDRLKKDVYDLHRQLTFKIPRATKKHEYYFISSTFEIERGIDYNGTPSTSQYKVYNYFTSEAEATKCAEKLQQYLIKLRKEEYCNE